MRTNFPHEILRRFSWAARAAPISQTRGHDNALYTLTASSLAIIKLLIMSKLHYKTEIKTHVRDRNKLIHVLRWFAMSQSLNLPAIAMQMYRALS
jgi:hypothetical protein